MLPPFFNICLHSFVYKRECFLLEKIELQLNSLTYAISGFIGQPRREVFTREIIYDRVWTDTDERLCGEEESEFSVKKMKKRTFVFRLPGARGNEFHWVGSNCNLYLLLSAGRMGIVL